MKKTVTTMAILAISASLLISCTYHRRNHNINLTVSESGDVYKLQAAYNEDKTADVQRYINRQIAPNGLFSSTSDYFDANTNLQDGTRFYIKSSPGKLIIKIKRQENSYDSYTRIKNMCQGIAGIIKEN